MLQSAFLHAKIGADTAENERDVAEILPIGRRVADRQIRPTSHAEEHVVEILRVHARQRLLVVADLVGAVAWDVPVRAANFLQIFTNFWRARSRLYQNEILQENMCLTAFFKYYKMCILLHRCNLKN